MAPTKFERSDDQLSGSWIGRAERQEELMKVCVGLVLLARYRAHLGRGKK